MLYDKRWDEPKVTAEPWREILTKAADYIEEHGWIQGSIQSAKGNVCMVGAMYYANYGDFKGTIISGMVPGDLAKALSLLAMRLGEPAWKWNDRVGRTPEEVVSVLRESAKAP